MLRFQTGDLHKRIQQENQISKTLVSIVIIFIIVHFLRIIATFGELWMILLNLNKDNSKLHMGHGVPMWFEIIAAVSDLLLVINSSVNVIIYMHQNSTELFTTFSTCMPKCLKRCFTRNNSSIVLHTNTTQNPEHTNDSSTRTSDLMMTTLSESPNAFNIEILM